MNEIIIPKKSVIMDATLASTLMSCGRYTDFRMNMQLQSTMGKSNSLLKGSLVHYILEHFNKAMMNGKNRKDAIEIGYAKGKEYSDKEMGEVPQEDIIMVNDTMQQYFEHYKNDSWVTLGAERVKQILLYEDDEIRIIWKAKLDWEVDTNNGIISVDHKTMSRRSDPLSLNNQFMGQCIVMKTRNMIVNEIGFQKTLKPVEKFQRKMMSYTLDRLTEWSQVIIPYWARMLLFYNETGYFPPNFTHCESKYSICQFKQVCESDTGMREEVLRLHYIRGEKWDVLNEEND